MAHPSLPTWDKEIGCSDSLLGEKIEYVKALLLPVCLTRLGRGSLGMIQTMV